MRVSRDAIDAVPAPIAAIPTTMSTAPTRRPSPVTGYRSSYPTVVIGVNAHRIASPNGVIDASGASRSASGQGEAPATSTVVATSTGGGDDPFAGAMLGYRRNRSYMPCVPIASDVDCEGGSGDGRVYTARVQVIGPDDYGLDRDGNGVGRQ
jgi:hypothetical protein